MHAQAADSVLSVEQRESQFRVLQDDAVQFVCEILFDPAAATAAVVGGFDRGLQDTVLAHLGAYLEALRQRPSGPGEGEAPGAWFEAMLTARGAQRRQVVQLNAALAAFLDRRTTPDAARIAAQLRGAELEVEKDTALRAVSGAACAEADSGGGLDAATCWAALRRGDAESALRAVEDGVARGSSLLDCALALLQPPLQALGEVWPGDAHVQVEERRVIATAQRVLEAAMLRRPAPAANGRRVILACVCGNQHAFGLRLVAEAFRAAGWMVDDLGPDVPASALVAAVGDRQPDVVGLSLSLPMHMPALREAAAQLVANFGAQRPGVLAGGLALRRASSVTEIPGVDAFGVDAKRAVASANELCRLLG